MFPLDYQPRNKYTIMNSVWLSASKFLDIYLDYCFWNTFNPVRHKSYCDLPAHSVLRHSLMCCEDAVRGCIETKIMNFQANRLLHLGQEDGILRQEMDLSTLYLPRLREFVLGVNRGGFWIDLKSTHEKSLDCLRIYWSSVMGLSPKDLLDQYRSRQLEPDLKRIAISLGCDEDDIRKWWLEGKRK